jgi:hypothetical protein
MHEPILNRNFLTGASADNSLKERFQLKLPYKWNISGILNDPYLWLSVNFMPKCKSTIKGPNFTFLLFLRKKVPWWGVF